MRTLLITLSVLEVVLVIAVLAYYLLLSNSASSGPES